MHFQKCSLTFLLIFACSCFSGCAEDPEVATYSVKSTSPPRRPFPLEQVDQILVAIVPQDDQAWFFKLVGKKPAIERQREAFDKFIESVKLADDPSTTPEWEVPEGWKEKEASAMRAATLVVPDSGGELDLAVSSLPLTVEWEDFLVPNVTRWLRQLQCMPLPKEKVLELAQQTSTASGTATVFHLSGLKAPDRTAANPHASLGIEPPPATQPAAAGPKAAKLKYYTPEGWKEGRTSMMRKASFTLPGGGASDVVAVTSFPAGSGQMSDVTANVERWARQVGIAKLSQDEVDELTSPITIDGLNGNYVELTSPDGAEQQISLFVAMLEREGQVWFFKMIGNSDLVVGQRDAFRSFLGSVEFE